MSQYNSTIAKLLDQGPIELPKLFSILMEEGVSEREVRKQIQRRVESGELRYNMDRCLVRGDDN